MEVLCLLGQLGGRWSDTALQRRGVRVLVNPCFAHPETELFSFFIAFEGLLTMKSKTCSAAITPADINCRLPQSLVLLPTAGNGDEIPFVEQHSPRGPPLFGLDIGAFDYTNSVWLSKN